MKKIAIIGAGFCGLSICYHLLQKDRSIEITLFDEKGIGSGASGTCSGLLHPYPGLHVRRSMQTDEAIGISKHLLEISQSFSSVAVADFSGILRQMDTEEQLDHFLEYEKTFKDVIRLEERLFLITSGVTVFVNAYMQGLWQACASKGAKLQIQKVSSLKELEAFDLVFIAAGWGIRAFPECAHLSVSYVKGQAFRCSLPSKKEVKSVVGKGYLATCLEENQIEIGSTYERGFSSEQPDAKAAMELLKPSFEALSPEAIPLACKAGVRVCRIGHYLPIMERLNERCFLLTAMGSRGLLYHGYFGKLIVESSL